MASSSDRRPTAETLKEVGHGEDRAVLWFDDQAEEVANF
jgi:hypothetical protein